MQLMPTYAYSRWSYHFHGNSLVTVVAIRWIKKLWRHTAASIDNSIWRSSTAHWVDWCDDDASKPHFLSSFPNGDAIRMGQSPARWRWLIQDGVVPQVKIPLYGSFRTDYGTADRRFEELNVSCVAVANYQRVYCRATGRKGCLKVFQRLACVLRPNEDELQFIDRYKRSLGVFIHWLGWLVSR